LIPETEKPLPLTEIFSINMFAVVPFFSWMMREFFVPTGTSPNAKLLGSALKVPSAMSRPGLAANSITAKDSAKKTRVAR